MRTRGTVVCGVVASIAALVWALHSPIPLLTFDAEARLNELLTRIEAPRDGMNEPSEPASLDLETLADVRLWSPREEPAAPIKAEATAPVPEPRALAPLTADLLAIVRESDGHFTAVMYSHAADELEMLTVGDAIEGRTIIDIDGMSLRLRDGSRERTLSLAVEEWSLEEALTMDGARRR
ncbi:MAG: hypothetical protein ACF8PN_02715 [Phycisphaerales bacterium]